MNTLMNDNAHVATRNAFPVQPAATTRERVRRWLYHAGFVLALALLWTAASAGPVRDFETAFRDAYKDYRAALFMTNSKDAAASAKAMAALESKWSAIASRWAAAPPPQYADDPSWPEVLRKVQRILEAARAQAGIGELVRAHETLEAFREVFGELHARNNVWTFSDHMNAYHAKMEEMLDADYHGFDAPGRTRLTKDVAVLEYLAGNLERHPPPEAEGSNEFKALVSALRGSIAAVDSALASSDASAIQKSVAGLKPAYSKFFLKFG